MEICEEGQRVHDLKLSFQPVSGYCRREDRRRICSGAMGEDREQQPALESRVGRKPDLQNRISACTRNVPDDPASEPIKLRQALNLGSIEPSLVLENSRFPT